MFKNHTAALVAVVVVLAALAGVANGAPGDISLISVRTAGQITSMYESYGAHLSADGRFLVFFSNSPDLVAKFTGPYVNLFVRNLQTDAVEAEFVGGSDEVFADNDTVAISGDGRYLVFTTAAASIVNGDTNGVGDVFLRDRQAGTTERVSLSSGGGQGAQVSYAPSIKS